jgi:DNA helicase II / ATP-dependent DNA helicase PcrA
VSVQYSPAHLARLLRLPEPTVEQAAVIGAPLGPMAVIAGAGSGKSETMAARLVWLVANGMVRPDRVLGLTFTRKAAGELADRVRSRLDRLRRAGLGATDTAGTAGPPPGAVQRGDSDQADDESGPWPGEPVIGTYHAYAGRLVSDHALREGLEPSQRLITPALSWQMAASIVAAYDGPMDEIGWTPQTVTAAVLQLAGDLAEHLREPADIAAVGEWLARQRDALPGKPAAAVRRILESQRAREQMLPLVSRYAVAKAAREELDHGDQVAIAARIASRHPEVGAAERGRYQVVLLDEYQDTSHAQLVLLRSLFGGGHPVTAVGDPCQSIYGWRGASAGNLRRFTTDFPSRTGGPAPVSLLSTSFRSAGHVLDAAALIQTELRRAAPDVPLLAPAPDRAARGAVTCALLPAVTIEAEWVANEAAGLLALPPGSAPDGKPWPDGRAAGVRPSDIAVLCRKRSQFTALRRALERRGIPCEVVGLGGLLSVPEVQDVVATLRVLHDASASDALARLLTGPRWRIGPRDLVALGRRARDLARGLDTVPADTVPENRVPANTGPENSAQANTGPANTGPANTGPGKTAPGSAEPGLPASVLTGIARAHDDAVPWPAGPADDEEVPWPSDEDYHDGDDHGEDERGDHARPEPAASAPAAPDAESDAIAEAVTDLTSDTGSLVEALDDLGDPAGYSQAGYARLRALAAETRRLRAHVSRPIADIIAEVERTLSLDIEVAARPGLDQSTTRADLDKFTDVAAAFAGDQPEPTLGAFLAYLTAAQQEEFGLETGRVGEADTVKLLTVHAAKGLQWPAVFVPGLAAGDKSQVFPARPRQSTKWTDNPRLIPFSLRGDVADLPSLSGLDADSLAEFTAACADRDLAEERRLAYVAATRAAFWLGCSGYWWGEGTAPLGPSVFLAEVREACEAGSGAVREWTEPPDDEASNPLLAAVDEADWPVTAAGQHYAAVHSARLLVEAAMHTASRGTAPGSSPSTTGPAAAAIPAVGRRRRRRGDDHQDALFTSEELTGPPEGVPSAGGSPAVPALAPAEQELVAAWDLDAGLLLAERDRQQRRGKGPIPVMLPARLSVSALVALARDPDELARQVRRPMPQPPARQARRGTEFHRWLEERFGQQRLIADDDLFADPEAEPDGALARLRERFEAGEWGDRWPREVEVPFDTLIGDRQIRGRIDAVFADGEGGFDVVDWKTGQPPRTQAEKDAVAVQLAAYRLAWAAIAGIPLGQVRAAFYYVRHELTVRPADLLDEAGLKALIDRVPVASHAG